MCGHEKNNGVRPKDLKSHIMIQLRESATSIQRFLMWQLIDNFESFLYDANGTTVYAENYEGWRRVEPDFISGK